MNEEFNPLEGIEGKELQKKDIDEILSADFLNDLYSITDLSERARIRALLNVVAKKQGFAKELQKVFKAYDEEEQAFGQSFKENNNYTDYSFQNQPLKCGGWTADDRGVRIQRANGEIVWASKIPILPEMLIENVGTGIEKVVLTYRKTGTSPRQIIVERNVIAATSNIVKLANKGIEVTSENARALVRFLSDVITNNLDVIPYHKAFSQLGWSELGFIPYTEDAVFDGEDVNRAVYSSVRSEGNFEEWKQFTLNARKNILIRLMMDASFASALISKVSALPFVFHLWGKTGTGKTVALKVAMSIWGDPRMGKLVRTMNMTQNSMMSTTAFLNSIPFAGDELQTIKSRWDNYDQLIMRITEGIDRGRMNELGNQRETKTWACSFLFTGEEPCTRLNSGGGAKNRVIEAEISDALFDKIAGNEAAAFVDKSFGHAGQTFTDYIQTLDDLPDRFKDLFLEVMNVAKTTDKQASSMALILLADRLANECVYDNAEDKLEAEQVKDFLASAEDIDLSERAYSYIVNYIARNWVRFETGDSNHGEFWGQLNSDHCMFNIDALKKALSAEGFEFDAVKKSWAYKGYLELSKNGRYSICTTCFSQKARYVHINLPEVENVEDSEDVDDFDF